MCFLTKSNHFEINCGWAIRYDILTLYAICGGDVDAVCAVSLSWSLICCVWGSVFVLRVSISINDCPVVLEHGLMLLAKKRVCLVRMCYSECVVVLGVLGIVSC